MKPYPKYKDSGVEWLGRIPEGWEVKPLFAVGTEGSESNKGMVMDNLLSLSYGNIIRKDINTNEGLLPESFETYQIVRKGDIVFRLTDLQNDKRSLRSGLVKEDGIITSAYLALKPSGADSNYLSALFRAYDKSKVFYSMGGGLRQSLKFGEMKRMPVLLPPAAEQQAIASYLDRETAKIDQLKEEMEALVALVSQEISSMVFSSSKIQELRLSAAVQEISRPVIREDSPSYTKLGLYNRGRGIFHKDPSEADEMGDSDFFWVKEGDCIISGQFAWEGAVALAGREDDGCVVSHRYPVIRGRDGVALTEYIFALFCTAHGNFLLNDNSRGAAGRNRPLNIGSLLKEKVPIPDMQTQQRVARAVHKRSEVLSEIGKARQLLEEYRSSLIHEAVTGKIDLREEAA